MLIRLPSGLTIDDCVTRLSKFTEEEFEYYDGIQSSDPNHISPEDVIVTTAVNSQLNAGKIRSVHREISSKCDSILAEIPESASLISGDVNEELIENLFREACSVRWVLMPVATKILHRKRRELIPILDNVILTHYVGEKGVGRAQDGNHAPKIGMECLKMFRADLTAAWDDLHKMLVENNFRISEVRALEALIWMEIEPFGSYRT